VAAEKLYKYIPRPFNLIKVLATSYNKGVGMVGYKCNKIIFRAP